MTWRKKNLVTNSDGSDTYLCTECGHTQKYKVLGSVPAFCPKCSSKNAVFGGWSDAPGKCSWCNEKLVLCPREGHLIAPSGS